MMPTTMLFPAKWRHLRGEFAFAIDFSRENWEKCKSLIIFDEEIIDKIELWLPKKLFFQANVRCDSSRTEFKVNEARVRVVKTDIVRKQINFHYFPSTFSSNSTTGHVIKSSWNAMKKSNWKNSTTNLNKKLRDWLGIFFLFSQEFSHARNQIRVNKAKY